MKLRQALEACKFIEIIGTNVSKWQRVNIKLLYTVLGDIYLVLHLWIVNTYECNNDENLPYLILQPFSE